jgi:hypothetical protein
MVCSPRRRCALRFLLPIVALAFSPAAVRAQAVNNSQLSGYVYIDRNNDGTLAFSDQASPELVLPGVTIELLQLVGSTPTVIDTKITDSIGRYEFTGLAAGIYGVRQIQPVQFVDGLETVGSIRTLLGALSPPGSSPGNAVAPNSIFSILLPASTRGDLYNFGERGLASAYVSKRYLLGTAPPPVFTEPPAIPSVTVPEPASGGLVAAMLAVLVRTGRSRRVARRRLPL